MLEEETVHCQDVVHTKGLEMVWEVENQPRWRLLNVFPIILLPRPDCILSKAHSIHKVQSAYKISNPQGKKEKKIFLFWFHPGGSFSPGDVDYICHFLTGDNLRLASGLCPPDCCIHCLGLRLEAEDWCWHPTAFIRHGAGWADRKFRLRAGQGRPKVSPRSEVCMQGYWEVVATLKRVTGSRVASKEHFYVDFTRRACFLPAVVEGIMPIYAGSNCQEQSYIGGCWCCHWWKGNMLRRVAICCHFESGNHLETIYIKGCMYGGLHLCWVGLTESSPILDDLFSWYGFSNIFNYFSEGSPHHSS